PVVSYETVVPSRSPLTALSPNTFPTGVPRTLVHPAADRFSCGSIASSTSNVGEDSAVHPPVTSRANKPNTVGRERSDTVAGARCGRWNVVRGLMVSSLHG